MAYGRAYQHCPQAASAHLASRARAVAQATIDDVRRGNNIGHMLQE